MNINEEGDPKSNKLPKFEEMIQNELQLDKNSKYWYFKDEIP